MGARGVDFLQLRGHCLRLVDAAAHHSRRGIVILTQGGQRLGIAGIQPGGLFKLRPHPLGQRIRTQKRRPAGLLAQGASQPQMIVRILSVQLYRLFAIVRGSIPLLQRVFHAASEVIGFGPAAWLCQRVQAALVPCPPRRPARPHWPGQAAPSLPAQAPEAVAAAAETSPAKYEPRQHPHRTTLIGTPSCKGCPFSVPVATRSPSSSPERMATWVRLMVPVVT